MTDQWTNRLSDYLDDELTAEERVSVEAHVTGCAACAATLRELDRVRRRAMALDAVPPRADLWPGIAERIGVTAQTRRVAPTGRVVPLARRRFALSVPQLAAAAAVLVMLGAGGARLARTPDAEGPAVTRPALMRVTPAAAYDAAIAHLEQLVAERRDELDPRTLRVLEESLLTIDRAILRAQSALADEPDDTYLQHHLAETRQRKLDLLTQVTTLPAST